MPVVIRELVIRATVSDQPAKKGGGASPTGGSNSNDREVVVKEIVEQVLEIMEKQKER